MVAETTTAQQTINLGRALGRTLRGGEVLLLTGELGSGKTTFAKGVAQGLGVRDDITSPSFIVLAHYRARHGRTFVHVDGYRLSKADEARSIGLEDYFGRADSVVAIEWPARLKPLIEQLKVKGEKLNKVRFEIIDEATHRISY